MVTLGAWTRGKGWIHSLEWESNNFVVLWLCCGCSVVVLWITSVLCRDYLPDNNVDSLVWTWIWEYCGISSLEFWSLSFCCANEISKSIRKISVVPLSSTIIVLGALFARFPSFGRNSNSWFVFVLLECCFSFWGHIPLLFFLPMPVWWQTLLTYWPSMVWQYEFFPFYLITVVLELLNLYIVERSCCWFISWCYMLK